MLGDGMRAIAKDENVAGRDRRAITLDKMTARSGKHGFAACGFGPIAGVGGNRFGFSAMQRAPNAAYEAKAVGADATDARLMMIGRAEPAPRLGDDVITRIIHDQPPNSVALPAGRGVLPG